MTSRDKWDALCRFQAQDCIPVDYIAHYDTDKRLKEYFQIKSENELLDRLGSDFYYLPCRDLSQNEGFMNYYKPPLKVTETERICALGMKWRRDAKDHKFCVDEAISSPLENLSSVKELEEYPWPVPENFDFSLMAEDAIKNKDRIIIGGFWTGIMGDAYRLHGFQNFLTNIALEPELMKALIDKLTSVYFDLNKALFETLKGKMDIWFFGNDFGGQNGLLMSLDMWSYFYKENIQKLTDLAHSYGLKVMMHSCGSISQLIPGLIEAGVDILDPIQVSALGMDPVDLAEQFGGKIIFHGGMDTQQVLPFGCIDEVRALTKKIENSLGRTGGYILSGSQLLGPDIPVENILAMYGVD